MPLGGCRPDIKSVSMRRSRFRWKAGCKSWVSRSASGNINDYLDNLVPKVFQAANCTRGWRDLTEQEVDEMKEPSRGKYPERSRKAKDRSRKVQPKPSISDEDMDQQMPPMLDEDLDQQSTHYSEDMDQQSAHYSEGTGQIQVLDFDFRYQVPSNPWEKRAIQRALAPTRMGD